MVHHTVRRLYGDNCFYADNSWKRYQRANTGDTLIFNFGNTCCGGGYSYGGCCGGGSFWGGFGAGIGMGIANLFSGFMGGFMGMPFMNMFGNMWGGGLFGGGMPWASYWGGGGAYTPSTKTAKDDAGAADDDVKPLGASNTHTHHCDDIDSDKITGFRGELALLDTTPDQTKLQDLYNRVMAAKAGQDDIHRPQDDYDYNLLIDRIKDNAKKNNFILTDGDGNSVDLGNGVRPVASAPEQGPDTAYTEAMTALGLTEPQIRDLFGLGIKIIDLPYGAPNNKGLSLPSTINKANLEKLKTIIGDKNIPVAMAHNPQASIDRWIAGKIGNISEGQDGKVSFEIDCTSIGRFGYKYKATNTDGNKYNVDCITTTLRSGHRKSSANGVEYTFGTSGYLERNAEPLIRTT